MHEQTLIALTFVAYCAVLVALTWLAYRQTQSLSDYILGGRRLGRWVAALSAGASDMSGWLLLGLPGYAYLSGLEAGWIVIGLFIGTSLNWIFIAPRLRQASEKNHNALTIPEFLEHYFQDKTHSLRFISAVFILLFYFFYTSAGLVAAGKLFETVFSVSYHWSVIIGTLIVLLYTAFGGFLAVSWTDLFQGLLMFIAMLMVVVFALDSAGGFNISMEHINLSNSALLDPFSNASGETLSLITIISLMSWGLGYFGQPHILARFMAIQSTSMVPSARNIAIGWSGFCLLFALMIGLAGIVLIEPALTDSDSETVLMKLLPILFHPLFAGVVLAAILAAIMSTADSQLLVAASVFTEDLTKTVLKKPISESGMVFIGRLAVLVMATLACLLALQPDNKVLDLVAYAWAGFGAAFGPLLIFVLYTNITTKYGALAGIITGGLTVVIWKNLKGGLFDVYELLPAFIISTISILIVSRLTKNSS